ncbi:P-loop NTPase fold protein [Rheinheimera sp.]|uniref:P-loop NTPase fold protein n=1 Tax=Rheinheimera sp. TaxID=1869214 RepID=UPI0023527927|nr:P-loop NTPase fold protein [Rheinheimera sp.]
MKLMVPQLDLDQQKGFAADIDIFKRKDFGEHLANLIEHADDNPVIALDSGWGEGKSTFIKMWQGYVEHQRSTKLKTIYFDAFKNDYQKDPFLALASEIYALLDDKDSKKRLLLKIWQHRLPNH